MNEIRKKRKELGLTQQELAKKTGISYASIRAYENDIRQPKLQAQIKLSEVLNIPIPQLELRTGGLEKYYEIIKTVADNFKRLNDNQLQNQVERIEKTKLRSMEPLAIAHAIDLVITTYDIYFERDDYDITTDLTGIIYSLGLIVKNQSDEYEDIIERFTKLVNLLKEQNKKATDND